MGGLDQQHTKLVNTAPNHHGTFFLYHWHTFPCNEGLITGRMSTDHLGMNGYLFSRQNFKDVTPVHKFDGQTLFRQCIKLFVHVDQQCF